MSSALCLKEEEGGGDEMKRLLRVERPLDGTCVGEPTGVVYQVPGSVSIGSRDENDSGSWNEFYYIRRYEFELGEMYINNQMVLYSVDKKYLNLFNNAINTITHFEYKSEKMEKEMSKYLPSFDWKYETDDRLWMTIKKTPDLLLLKDVIAYFGGKLGSRHVAWIMSTLHNLVCYLQYAKISHNGIATSSYFISPVHHSGALLGGWWYSVPVGERMIAVPRYTSRRCSIPPKSMAWLGSIGTDLELIRAVGRESLGPLPWPEKEIPKALGDWLTYTSPHGDAFEDYKIWDTEVLKDSFGPRRFVELSVTSTDLYGKKGGE